MRYLIAIWGFMANELEYFFYYSKVSHFFAVFHNDCLLNDMYWACIWNIPYNIRWCFVLKRMKCDSFTPTTCQTPGDNKRWHEENFVSLTIRSFTSNPTNNSWKSTNVSMFTKPWIIHTSSVLIVKHEPTTSASHNKYTCFGDT